jgi:hypothetical protein
MVSKHNRGQGSSWTVAATEEGGGGEEFRLYTILGLLIFTM